MKHKKLTAGRLREVLDYDAVAGLFTWRIARGRVKSGYIAGRIGWQNYRNIHIDGRWYRACRLAWLYTHGEWPNGQIDHKNHINTDDSICNLRDVTTSENQQNQIKAQRHSKTGLLGVSPRNGRFQAGIRVDGKRIHLGTFSTPDDAHAAYLEAKRRLHTGCTI